MFYNRVHWPVALHPNGKDDIPRTPEGRRDIDWDWDAVDDTWPQMEEVYRSGKARAIGVSNFSVPYMKRLLKSATIPPVMNQIECALVLCLPRPRQPLTAALSLRTHPYLPSNELRELCAKHNGSSEMQPDADKG